MDDQFQIACVSVRLGDDWHCGDTFYLKKYNMAPLQIAQKAALKVADPAGQGNAYIVSLGTEGTWTYNEEDGWVQTA